MRNDFSDSLAERLNTSFTNSGETNPLNFIRILLFIRPHSIIEHSSEDLAFKALVTKDDKEYIIAHFYFDIPTNKWYCKF